jgi:hypothetical protein
MDISFLLNAVAYVFLAGLVIYLVIRNIRLRDYIATNSVDFLKLKVESQHKIEFLQNELNKRENVSIEQTDGFVKFISDSREWAFDYIESVQQSIQELQIAVESGYPTEEKLAKLFSLLPENKEK